MLLPAYVLHLADLKPVEPARFLSIDRIEVKTVSAVELILAGMMATPYFAAETAEAGKGSMGILFGRSNGRCGKARRGGGIIICCKIKTDGGLSGAFCSGACLATGKGQLLFRCLDGGTGSRDNDFSDQSFDDLLASLGHFPRSTSLFS